MMNQKHNILHGSFIYDGKKLNPATKAQEANYKNFLLGLEANQKVDIFFEAGVDNGTLPQLAKCHVCIRELAKETGTSFEDMKLIIKRMAGLCIEKEIEGNKYMLCKSFADCSIDELGLAMQAIIQAGETVGINFN